MVSGALAELWEWGFELGGRRFGWGTLGEELATALDHPVASPLAVWAGEAHGLPALHQMAWFPHRERPVTGVAFQLAAEANLHEEATLAALRARLDGELGPGRHEWSEHGPEKANSRWDLAGATVWLTAFPAPWAYTGGRSTGRLNVTADRERLAAPFLPAFRGLDEPWAKEPGEIEVIAAPGLHDMRGRPWVRDEISFALGRPELRAPPAWVTARLETRDRVAIWRHGDTRGLATDLFTLPFPAATPPPMRHSRWAAARGPGYASLDLDADRDLLLTSPGPGGLDAVAARLEELGVPIERAEEQDWG